MPKVVDHEALRRTILEGAFSLFAGQGYSTVTMRGLSRELGVSTGKIYHYFPTKQALFEQLVPWLAERDVLDAMNAIEGVAPGLPRVLRLIQWVEDNEAHFADFMRLSVDYRRADLPSGVVETSLNTYRQLLVEHAGIRDPITADLLFDHVLGVVIRRTLDPSSPSLAEGSAPLLSRLL